MNIIIVIYQILFKLNEHNINIDELVDHMGKFYFFIIKSMN